MEENNEEREEESAKFNMALDTLKRLGKNLEEQKQLSYKTDYTMDERQAVKIGLVKQFFVQAAPLLPKETVEEYKKEILSLTSKIINLTRENYMEETKSAGTQIIYDQDLEIRMDEIIIELQMILQKERYFMPSSEDEGDF